MGAVVCVDVASLAGGVLLTVAIAASIWLLPLLLCLPKAWEGMRNDLGLLKRDPALRHPIEALFGYPGLWALWWYRLSHELWELDVPIVSWMIPRFTMGVVRCCTAVDIHPAATLSAGGIMIDHATGVVIGATAHVGARTTIYHEVTLGATGRTTRKGERRHPIVGEDCMLGAGCKILGAITVGNGCTVGANSVVTRDVPSKSTVVGIPGRIIGVGAKGEARANADTNAEAIRNLHERLSLIEVYMHSSSRPTTPKDEPHTPTLAMPKPTTVPPPRQTPERGPSSPVTDRPSPSQSPELMAEMSNWLPHVNKDKRCAVGKYWSRMCQGKQDLQGFHGLACILDSLQSSDEHEDSFASAAL